MLDVIASLDDIASRNQVADRLTPQLVAEHPRDSVFWQGLVKPQSPRDHSSDTPKPF